MNKGKGRKSLGFSVTNSFSMPEYTIQGNNCVSNIPYKVILVYSETCLSSAFCVVIGTAFIEYQSFYR